MNTEINKTCSCGKPHPTLPLDAKFFRDEESSPLSGYYWNCECGSTMFLSIRSIYKDAE